MVLDHRGRGFGNRRAALQLTADERPQRVEITDPDAQDIVHIAGDQQAFRDLRVLGDGRKETVLGETVEGTPVFASAWCFWIGTRHSLGTTTQITRASGF